VTAAAATAMATARPSRRLRLIWTVAGMEAETFMGFLLVGVSERTSRSPRTLLESAFRPLTGR
jgi:hypothetical protein